MHLLAYRLAFAGMILSLSFRDTWLEITVLLISLMGRQFSGSRYMIDFLIELIFIFISMMILLLMS
ncbi:hypothetical protein ABB30_14150 [Stenotrophomonas ginsengisoli]|uniref:Uncharacterized protein n=1 Tax=Stenotrophomonas ginsengisoli TaxID=336566 RepID=A0A0R0D8U4_9GAMM|nr:hypothetical protein ABB30_14150 [Stenotrophomonas ginsengisoli]